MGKINLKQTAKLHNKFHLILTDGRTNEVRQEAWAYNIVLNNGLRAWVDQFCLDVDRMDHASRGNVKIMRAASAITNARSRLFGGRIYLGKGAGVLDPNRTSLFEHYYSKNSSFFDRGMDVEKMTAFYTQYIQSTAGEFNGHVITEVGLGPTEGSSSELRTHAMIEDSEGNPINVTPGAFDILTVYATVFIEIHDTYENVKFVTGGNGNILLRMVYSNMSLNDTRSFGSSYTKHPPNVTIHLGSSKKPLSASDQQVGYEYAAAGTEIGKADYDNHKATFSYRLEAPNGNLPMGVWEVGASAHKGYFSAEFDFASEGSTLQFPIFRSIVPIPGVWTGYIVTGEELGNGDGAGTDFNLRWPQIEEDSEAIYVQDRIPKLQVKGEDYSFNDTSVSYGKNIGASADEIVLQGGATTSPLKNAVDGDLATSSYITGVTMSGSTYTSQPRLIFHYPTINYTDHVRVYQGITNSGSIRAFRFEGSNDLEVWTTVLSAEMPNSIGWREFNFAEVGYRYWRFVVTTSWSTSTYSVIYALEWKQTKPQLQFTCPPEAGKAVTADYRVKCIPKDENHVLDVSFTIQFADANA